MDTLTLINIQANQFSLKLALPIGDISPFTSDL